MKIPKNVMDLFNSPEATKVLTSVSANGIPHSIVVGSVMAPSEDFFCAAEIMMKTTSANLESNPKVAAIAVKGMESFQIVGTVMARQTEGELFDNVNAKLAEMNMACSAVWMFTPEDIYDESAGPNAGTKLA
jgi:hypothetical protein